MHETNGSSNGAEPPAKSGQILPNGDCLNGQPIPGRVEQPGASADVAPAGDASPKPQQILDESLEDWDVKISISVRLHGRTTEITTFAPTKVFYEGLESFGRGMLLNSIKKFLEEDVYQPIAVKINRKFPVKLPDKPVFGENHNEKSRRKSEPIPPFTEDALDDDGELKLHVKPPD